MRSSIYSLLFSVLCAGAAVCAEDRIGYSEEFNDMKGWSSGSACKLRAEEGLGIFRSSVGSWTKSFKWSAEEPYKSIAADTTWAAKSFGTVDLDKYHYLVARVVEKGCVCRTHFCGKEIEVTYSTGIIAQDLKPLGIGGKTEAKISFELSNNNAEVKIDYLRLVSELSDEEKKGLLPNPIAIKAEGIARVPYDHLTALWTRAARPAIGPLAEEQCAFIDPGTGTRKWRMTATEAHENFSEHSGSIWNGDGSAFYVLGRREGKAAWLYDKDAFEPRKCLPGDAKYSYYWKWLKELFKPNPEKGKPGLKTFAIIRTENETGKEEELTRIETWEAWEFTEWEEAGDGIMTFALRETPMAWIVYTNETDPQKRLREIKLPSRLKGFAYDHANQRVSWHTCYTYESNVMDLKTGAVTRGAQHTFGHGPGCREFAYGSISSNGKGIAARGAGATPGDKLRIAGIYTAPLSIDYGSVAADRQWIFSNGVGGDVDKQHVMVNLADGGTVLRMATYWTSYADWDRPTRGGASPDSTKYVYISDMLGNGDYYFAIIRNPDPPRDCQAAREAGTVTLTWDKPVRCAEARGYNIYRSAQSGREFQRINAQPVAATSYIDKDAPASAFYLVAMEEHSGLEGHFSNEASADYDHAGAIVLHYDAICGEHRPPLREVLGGGPPSYRYLRVTKVKEGEQTGSLTLTVNAPRAGEYLLLARVRNNAGKKGAFEVAGAGTIAIDGRDWQWVRAPQKAKLSKGPNRLVFTSANEDDCVERVVLASDDGYQPLKTDDRKPSAPAQPTGLKVVEAGADRVRLQWDSAPEKDFGYWSVYVSEKPEFDAGNQTVLQSGRKPFALDWAIKPNTTWHYQVIAYDKRGNASPPARISAKTAALAVVTSDVPPAGLKTGESKGTKYVTGQGDATYDFELAAAGKHYLWLKYSPRHSSGTKLKLALDGKTLDDVSVCAPGRLGRTPEIPAGAETWYFTRIKASPTDYAFDLPAAKHALKFTVPQNGPWLSTVYVTNDVSFTPPGFDPAVELNKR